MVKCGIATGYHLVDVNRMVFVFTFRNHSKDYRNMPAATDTSRGNGNIRSLIGATLQRKGYNEKVPRVILKSLADKKALVNDSIVYDHE